MSRRRPRRSRRSQRGLRDRARRGAEDRGRRGAREDRPVLARPDHRRHPLQRQPRAEGDRGRACRRCASIPGTSAAPTRSAEVVRAAKKAGIAMRIGANSGSLPKHLESLAQEDQAEALVEAALEEVRLLESARLLRLQDLRQVEPRPDDDPRLPASSSARVPYPLHLGVTEAGPPSSGAIKSAVGMGTPPRRRDRRHDARRASRPIRSRRSRSPGRS